MRIRYVIDTHIHADHLSSGRELAAATGVAYVLFRGVPVDFAFDAVEDGTVLEFGNVTAEVLHVPGHTPEHIALLVTGHTRAEEPWLVFTGHTLMAGDVGRAEFASNAVGGSRALFGSLPRLNALPDYVEVLPGTNAGSVCGRGLSGRPASTIVFERRQNAVFATADETEFVRIMLGERPPPPANAAEYRAANASRAAAPR